VSSGIRKPPCCSSACGLSSCTDLPRRGHAAPPRAGGSSSMVALPQSVLLGIAWNPGTLKCARLLAVIQRLRREPL
jgi:hypothetical protein